MNRENIGILINRFTESIAKLYERRLQEIVLYESYVRGDATAGSDIDLMIVLKNEKISFGKEINRMNKAATDVRAFAKDWQAGICIKNTNDITEKNNVPRFMVSIF